MFQVNGFNITLQDRLLATLTYTSFVARSSPTETAAPGAWSGLCCAGGLSGTATVPSPFDVLVGHRRRLSLVFKARIGPVGQSKSGAGHDLAEQPGSPSASRVATGLCGAAGELAVCLAANARRLRSRSSPTVEASALSAVQPLLRVWPDWWLSWVECE